LSKPPDASWLEVPYMKGEPILIRTIGVDKFYHKKIQAAMGMRGRLVPGSVFYCS